MELVRDGEGAAPRSWRGGRLLPAAVFIVLVAAALAVFVVVRTNVDNQNRRLLRERTGEVALVLQSAVGNLSTSLQPLGVAQRLGGTAAFLKTANEQTSNAPNETIALVRTSGSASTVIAAAGLAPVFPKGATITGEPARALAAAMREIVEDEQLRRRLANNGHAVAQRYSWAQSAARHAEIYRAALTAVWS